MVRVICTINGPAFTLNVDTLAGFSESAPRVGRLNFDIIDENDSDEDPESARRARRQKQKEKGK